MTEAVPRLMAESDVDAVLRLQREWTDENITWGFVPDTREGVRSYLGAHAFVAETCGQLIGYTLGRLEPVSGLAALPADTPCMEVVDLYVSPCFRSQGIGGMLIQALLASAEDVGVTSFRLTSGTKDIQRVTSFYGRHGFRTVSVAMVRHTEA